MTIFWIILTICNGLFAYLNFKKDLRFFAGVSFSAMILSIYCLIKTLI